jgi:hypothetical protein
MVEIVNGKEIAVEVISPDEAKAVFGGIRNGQIFGAVFTKKDGSERKMNCRRGVKKHLKGGTLKYNPADFGLIGVCDMQLVKKSPENSYRMLNVNTTTEIHTNKKRYLVVA